jgi:hypothetical protein
MCIPSNLRILKARGITGQGILQCFPANKILKAGLSKDLLGQPSLNFREKALRMSEK